MLRVLKRGVMTIALTGLCTNVLAAPYGGQNLQKYLFISLSMPEASVIELLTQAKQQGVVPVMRGFKGGSYKETVRVMHEMIEHTGYGVNIDPELFKRFEVKVVPSFVLEVSDTSYHKLSGNVRVDYAFSQLEAVE